MGAPLALLAAYAWSAKQKGDRARNEAAQKLKAEAKQKQDETALWTLYELPNNTFGAARMDDKARNSFFVNEGARAVKTGQPSQLSYDVPAEKQQPIPIYRDPKTKKEGPMSVFSFDDQLKNPPYRIGIQDGLTGEIKYDADHIIKRREAGDPLASNPKRQYSAAHPDHGEFKGSYENVINWINKNNIKLDDPKLSGRQYLLATNNEGVEVISNDSAFNFIKEVQDNGPTSTKDILITLKDGTQFYESENRKYDPYDVKSKTTGTKVGDKWEPSAIEYFPAGKEDEPERAEVSELQKAINVGELPYYFKVGETIVGSKQNKPEDRISSVLTQLANSPESFNALSQGISSNSGSANRFVNGIFKDAYDAYNDTKVGPDGQLLYTYKAEVTFTEFVNDNYPSLLEIPGMQDKIKQQDEGRRQNRKNVLTQQNTTANTVASVSVIKEKAPEELAALDGVPHTLELAIVDRYPQKYQILVDTVLKPYLNQAIGDSRNSLGEEIPKEDAVNLAFGKFITYKTDERGLLVRDGARNPIPSDDQPILEYLESLRVAGIGGTNLTLFDKFIEILDPRKSKVDQMDANHKEVSIRFSDAVQGDIKLAVQVVAPMMRSSAGVNQAMNTRFAFGNSKNKEAEFVRDQRSVRDAARRGIDVVNQAIGTFTNPVSGGETGTQFVGNISLFVEGAKYLGGKAADFIGIDFNNKEAVVSAGMDYVTRSRAKLKALGGLKEDSDALARIEEDIRLAANSQYAKREFFTLVLAYEVAAAIQGGTGGRTISDQDVALIFRGLRQRWSDDAVAQLAALNAVKGMLERFEFRANLMSDSRDLKSRAAYLTAENMLVAAGFSPAEYYTTDYVVSEFSSEAVPPAGAGDFYGLGEEEYNNRLLEEINKNRSAVGDPVFNSIEDAKNDPMFSSNVPKILDTLNRRLSKQKET
jgi:hypothetical protein